MTYEALNAFFSTLSPYHCPALNEIRSGTYYSVMSDGYGPRSMAKGRYWSIGILKIGPDSIIYVGWEDDEVFFNDALSPEAREVVEQLQELL